MRSKLRKRALDAQKIVDKAIDTNITDRAKGL